MADAAAGVISDAAGGAVPVGTAAGMAGQALLEPRAPGSGDMRETLPEVGGGVLAEWARWAESRKFSVTRLRPGYDGEEVDAFLEAIRDTFLGVREPALTPDEIRNSQFSTTRLRPGYDEEEVDAVLDEAELRLAAWQRGSAPAAGPESVVADLTADTIGDGAGGAASAAAAPADGPTPPELYAPGRGEKVPASIRRVRRGYSYLGWGAVLGGWALFMAGGYFFDLGDGYDLRYLCAAVALLVCAAVLFGLRIRLSRFLRRPADAGSATVTACQRGGRGLMLYSPWDGYPSGLRVRLAWWAEPEMLLPGESVTFYGRPGGVGRLLIRSPSRDRAFVGTGRRRPASPAGVPAVQDAPPQTFGQRVGRYFRWGPAALASLAFVAAVTATVITAAPSLTGHLTEGQLRAGDCLTGSDLGLGSGNPWPWMFTTVPCTQSHEAEVFFSGNAWPESQKAYPGDDAIYSQAETRCTLEFNAYDGNDSSDSSFMFEPIAPFGGSDWSSGDRQLVCVAFIPDPSTSAGGRPVQYSIEGSER